MTTAARWTSTTLAALLLSAVAQPSVWAGGQRSDKPEDAKAPRLALRAQPSAGVAPTRVVLTAELVGGPNDFEDYYCAGVRWDWGDDTSSESSADCPPYEAGKSELIRRHTVEHVFKRSGTYRVYVHLRKRNKDVVSTSTIIRVQPGLQEPF